jgi:hypothetical protein
MASTPFPNNPNGADFVGSDDECEVETNAEPRERHEEGLYCPLYTGEVLDSRYRIEHKLGWGGFSTVWLAHDMQENKAVAWPLRWRSPGRGENTSAVYKTRLYRPYEIYPTSIRIKLFSTFLAVEAIIIWYLFFQYEARVSTQPASESR